MQTVTILPSELWYSHAAAAAARRLFPYRGHMTESSQLSHTPPVELRYFAAPWDAWELLLLRARQLGTDPIASRVPWAWHAPAPDVLDFDGATDRRCDLVGFVRLCSRLGLRVLLDPGPIHGNLLGAGVPAWLLQQHSSVQAHGPDGTPWLDTGGLPHPSPQHPEFLVAARGWIAEFSAAMRALQAPSGPIGALCIASARIPEFDDSQSTGEPRDTPNQLVDLPDEFAASYHDSATLTLLDWLRTDGWSVPLRDGSLIWQVPCSLSGPHAEPASAVLLELPAGPG